MTAALMALLVALSEPPTVTIQVKSPGTEAVVWVNGQRVTPGKVIVLPRGAKTFTFKLNYCDGDDVESMSATVPINKKHMKVNVEVTATANVHTA